MKRLLIPLGAGAILTGCASVDPRPAFSDVEKAVSQRAGQPPAWTRSGAEARQSSVGCLGSDNCGWEMHWWNN